MSLDEPPRGNLPVWGKRFCFDSFFVELVPSGERSLNVRLSDTFASISFGEDEGLSSLAGDRLRRFERRPHEYIITPPNFPIRGESESAPEVLVIVFDFESLRNDIASGLQVDPNEVEARVIIGAPKPFPTELAKRIRRQMLTEKGAPEYLKALCLVLVVEMMRSSAIKKNSAQRQKLDEGVLKLILAYIDTNLEANLTLKALASYAGVLTHQFARSFKVFVGETPHRYVLNRRISKARDLLLTTHMTIADIAYATGFSSQSHMTTAFKKELGKTPAQFRNLNEAADP